MHFIQCLLTMQRFLGSKPNDFVVVSDPLSQPRNTMQGIKPVIESGVVS